MKDFSDYVNEGRELLNKTCSKGENCVHPDGPCLPLDQFYVRKDTPGGLRSACKRCERARIQKWEQEHPDKKRAINLNWRNNNRERSNAINRRWKARNPAHQLNYNRQWRAANPEKFRARMTQWRASNRAYIRTKDHERRCRQRSLISQLTTKQWHWLLEQSGRRCVYCGKHESETGTLAQEHVVPVSQGGAFTVTNIRPACKSCNSRKRDRTPQQAGMEMVIKIDVLGNMKQGILL